MSDPQPRVLTLIDASGYIFRAYHALPPLTTSKGIPTNAVLGFTRMLLKTLRDFAPTHVALAFDKESRKGRQEIDPTYKANRDGPPLDLLPQFDLIRKVAQVLNLPVLEFAGWEADDVIGTLACQAKKEGFQVLIVTGDKDFAQIVDGEVQIYDPHKDKRIGPAEVKERYQVEPGQMTDYLALVGDAIDNVAKVPGIGPKTAVELLQQFGNVEALLARLDEVKKPKIRESLAAHQEQLRRAKTLVTFKTDLELGTTVEALERRPIHEAEARDLFTELEFYKLLQEMRPTQPTALATAPERLTDVASLEAFAKAAALAQALTLIPAFEGSPLSPTVVGFGFALPTGQSFYLPLGHVGLEAQGGVTVEDVRRVLGPVFADPAVKKSGHDLKGTSHVLHALGMSLDGLEGDVELLSYLLNPSRREHALADLTRERLRVELPQLTLGGKKGPRLAELTLEEVAPCLGASADAARRLAPELWEELERVGLAKLAREMELPLLPLLARMERAGVRIDPEALHRIRRRVETDCAQQLEGIYKHAGKEFNVNSNNQLADVLFTDLKLPVLKRGKTGPSTDQEVLEKLALQHPLPRAIIEYRGLWKLKTTYLDVLPELAARDGRIHTTFHPASTATGRLSSTDPNLQNIPIRSDTGLEIRRAFVAEPGARIVSADYSQVELRLLAHIAEDPVLIDAFQKDEDIHSRTAAEVFGVPQAEVTPNQRRAAKMVNFGIAYGLSPFGLSTRLDIPPEEAKGIIDRYFERYAGIRRYLEETVRLGKERGYVETLFGRRRYMPDLQSRNRAVEQAAERAAINMPIQGTAADLIKMAMLRIDRELTARGLRTRMLLQVHDELVFEAPEAEVAEVSELARREMSGVATLKVPLRVDVGSGESWADAH